MVDTKVEITALNAMGPHSPYGETGQTVQDRINQLTQQRAEFSELARQTTPIMETMSDQDWISYSDRMLMFGEASAMRWLDAKYGNR
jgi:hypothetical protein